MYAVAGFIENQRRSTFSETTINRVDDGLRNSHSALYINNVYIVYCAVIFYAIVIAAWTVKLSYISIPEHPFSVVSMSLQRSTLVRSRLSIRVT